LQIFTSYLIEKRNIFLNGGADGIVLLLDNAHHLMGGF